MYGAGALARIFLSRPNNNEAWFANPAVDLLVRHRMGTPVLEGAGMWLAGIDRHTYWTMPLYSLVQAPWYGCVGFSVVAQRGLTVLLGIGVLLCVYSLVAKLSTEWAAVIAVVLTASDFEFIRISAQGRMDMLCALLGFGGLVLYVRLRETQFGRAILLSNVAAAAACMTHPYGVLSATSLWALTIYFDGKRLGWREAGLIAGPYVVALALWGMYILPAPREFLAQFEGNAKGLQAEVGGAGRFNLMAHPLRAFSTEMRVRYFEKYNSKVVPLVYLGGLVAIVGLAWRTRRREYVAFALIAGLYFAELMLLEGTKRSFYLVHSIPALAMALAVVLASMKRLGKASGVVAGVVVAGLVLYQWRAQIRYRGTLDGLRDYFSVTRLLEANYKPGEVLMAPAEFAYKLGFYGGLTEDWRIGYATGKSPELIVLGGLGQGWLKHHQDDSPVGSMRW
jgi:4-amino-4-deoxy-L-arabinose transferase-like glycosyltransferase